MCGFGVTLADMERPQARVRDFVRSFGGHWFIYMSGAPSVPAAMLALYVENDIAKILLGLTAIGCAVLSAYFVWRAERLKVIDLTEKTTQKFKLSFHPECEGITTTPIRISRPAVGSPHIRVENYEGHYVRIRVEAIRPTPVRQCVAFITRVQKETDNSCIDIPLPHSTVLR
jgi:hypothetical protein